MPETQEESHTSVRLLINLETAGLVRTRQWPMNWLWPLSHGLGAPVLGNQVMNERASEEVLVSREGLAYSWTQNYEKVREAPCPCPHLPHYSPPRLKVAWLRAEGGICSPWLLSWRKGRACEWGTRFPACVGCCQRGSFLSLLIQSNELYDGGRKRLGGWHMGHLEDIKETWTQLCTLWSSSRSPTVNRWDHLTCSTPQMAHGHPQPSAHLTQKLPSSAASSQTLMAVTKWTLADG